MERGHLAIADIENIIAVMPWRFITHRTHSRPRRTKDQVDQSGLPNSAGATAHPSKTTIGVGALIEQRYRLDAELGRGGMGIVYRAHDIPNDREVAIKIMSTGDTTVSAREQFLREAQVTAKLNHPHIVTVYEIGSVNTGARAPSPFMAMEYVHGQGLDELHGLVFTQIVDLGRQICDALEYAHALGLVHRDLKPQNVLVEKRGFQYFAKLVDFGLARPRGLPNSPAESGVAGTVYYLAPEVIAGQPADVAADLYAFGVMLYEMVTGHVPFSDYDEQSILSQHLNESVVPPSQSRRDVPPALESIILRLLAKDPQGRFASAREVCQALEQIAVTSEGKGAHTNLPAGLPDLVARADEIAQIERLLEASRLVILLGVPVVSRTLLALACGARLTDQFSDGVWLVELKGLDAAAVPQTVAVVLSVPAEPSRALTVSLMEYLSEKNLLLILDHCDHLIGACAQLAETILQTCPEVRVLATSLAPLNISGETCYRVKSQLGRSEADESISNV